MNDHNGRHARLRHTATGALAALAAVGAIAGTAALAAQPRANTHRHAAMANNSTKAPPPGNGSTKTPAPGKHRTPQPPEAYDPHNPFLIAIQQLVDDGTITATEGQAVDREILSGYTDTQRLAFIGLTQTQIQAVEQASRTQSSHKRRPRRTPKAPAHDRRPAARQRRHDQQDRGSGPRKHGARTLMPQGDRPVLRRPVAPPDRWIQSSRFPREADLNAPSRPNADAGGRHDHPTVRRA